MSHLTTGRPGHRQPMFVVDPETGRSYPVPQGGDENDDADDQDQDDTSNGDDAHDQDDDGAADKAFTQADLDATIDKRLARERKKHVAEDPAVLASATDDGRLLLTLDRGLGDIRVSTRQEPGPASLWSASTTNHLSPSGKPSNGPPSRWTSPTSKDASQCGATANFGSVDPNPDGYPSIAGHYARLWR